MDEVTGALPELPAALWSRILSSLLTSATVEPLQQVMCNAVCRVWREAMTDAFAPAVHAEPTAHNDDSGGTPAPTAASPASPTSPARVLILGLDLDALAEECGSGTPGQVSAGLSRFGRRFARVAALRLTAVSADGAAGAAAFSFHVADHLTRVRHLLLQGSTSQRVDSLWRLPAASATLAAGVRHLTASLHHSSLAALAGNLATAFPGLLFAHLSLHTSPAEAAASSFCTTFRVQVPASLRSLHIALVEDIEATQPDESDTYTLHLHLFGDAGRLERLAVASGDVGRPVTLTAAAAGGLPALQELDVYLDDPSRVEDIPQMCPALRSLALRGVQLRLGVPRGIVPLLAPLGAGLRRLSLHSRVAAARALPRTDGLRDGWRYEGELRAVMVQHLPCAELRCFTWLDE